MDRTDLRKIANETIKITDAMSYLTDIGEYIFLPDYDYSAVEVLSPQKLAYIEEDSEGFFESNEWGKGAQYYVVDADSFEAAQCLTNPLVMNFANAHTPGGGFLSGARAQEECLCRCSTLYKSIGSDGAKEMYDFNNTVNDPVDSDYMLLSPDVCVFRDMYYNLISDPYIVSVVTIPAPNRNGNAYDVKRDVLRKCMENRLRKMLKLAARCGYKNLVLGAWGCGAFGNDTMEVAQIFYSLFFEEDFDKYFSVVCFAILGSPDKEEIFRNVFKEHLDKDTAVEENQESKADEETKSICIPKVIPFYQNKTDAPVCNHTSGITSKNKGYCQGTTIEGMPFEAEIYNYDSREVLSVIIPKIEYEADPDIQEKEEESVKSAGKGQRNECVDYSVLDIGMSDKGMESSEEIVKYYIDIIVDSGLVSFTGSSMNGHVEYRSDVRGNDFIKILIILKDNEQEIALSPISLTAFLIPEEVAPFHKTES